MDYSIYSIEELEEMALGGDLEASEELNKRYGYQDEQVPSLADEGTDNNFEEIFSKTEIENSEDASQYDIESSNDFEVEDDENDFYYDENEDDESDDDEEYDIGSDIVNAGDGSYYDDIEVSSWEIILHNTIGNIKLNEKGLRLQAIKQLPLISQKELMDEGDPYATYAIGERLLDSGVVSEMSDGIKQMMMAINALRDLYINGNITREEFIESIGYTCNKLIAIYKGWKKEKIAGELLTTINGENCELSNVLGKCIFTLCNNQYELDDSLAEGLITCYEDAIGCERDIRSATKLREKKATKGGFLDCIHVFSGYSIKEEYLVDKASLNEPYWNVWSVDSTLWAQRALTCSDADKYPKLASRIKMWLAENEQTDANGMAIDYVSQKYDYDNCNSETLGNDELYYLYLFAFIDERKQFAYHLLSKTMMGSYEEKHQDESRNADNESADENKSVLSIASQISKTGINNLRNKIKKTGNNENSELHAGKSNNSNSKFSTYFIEEYPNVAAFVNLCEAEEIAEEQRIHEEKEEKKNKIKKHFKEMAIGYVILGILVFVVGCSIIFPGSAEQVA